MGACASLNKGSVSSVKLRLGSRKEKLVIPSPVKEAVGGGGEAARDAAPKPQSSPARFAGSRDEAFFDSQPWLESDIEDDYYSINGDFTPSRGNTPLHHSFASAKVDKPAITEQKIESPPDDSSSPTTQKKRLSELFQDSLRIADQPNNLAQPENGTRTDSSERNNANERVITAEDDGKESSSPQCCVPQLLLRNSSLSGRKKKATTTNAVVDHSVG